MKLLKYKTLFVNSIYVLFVIALCRIVIQSLIDTESFESWGASEVLINYEGGFVRRGLLGQILFFISKNFHIDIIWMVKVICLLFLLIVVIFFVFHFKKKNYALYILPLCFFLGGPIITGGPLLMGGIIRKDYLIIIILISIIYIYNNPGITKILKFLFVNILFVFILLTHEMFAFITLPIFYLLLLNGKKNITSFTTSFIFILPAFIAFCVAIVFKGTPQIAQAIWDSLSILCYGESTTHSMYSIRAIGWDTIETIKIHLRANFFRIDDNILSSFAWLITFPLVYYISSNFLWVFRKNDEHFTVKQKNILSAILLFQLVSLSPAFIFLCIDYIRMFFFWITSSFVIFILTPIHVLENIFPKKYLEVVAKINNIFLLLLPPSRTLLMVFMLTIGISFVSFNIKELYSSSVIYQALYIVKDMFKYLFQVI